MLVVTDVGEELARAVVAEGGVGKRVAGLGAGAALNVVGADGDCAGGNPRRAGDHPLPAIFDRFNAAVAEGEVRLVVHALEALNDGFLKLVDHLGALAATRVDLVDPFVMNLNLKVG